ncbi:MAG: putative glycoside hydrolase [Candidatus Peregrinibacteria bacterium]
MSASAARAVVRENDQSASSAVPSISASSRAIHVSDLMSFEHGGIGARNETIHAAAPEGISGLSRWGVYLTEGSIANERLLNDTLDRLAASTGAALVFDVKGGVVHFAAASPLAEKLDLIRPAYDLTKIVQRAKTRGIYTIARFIAAKDPLLSQRLPETQIHHPETKNAIGPGWVDLSQEDVLTYNKEVLEEVVRSGVDEINLDYIRYPTEYAEASIGLTGDGKADHIETFLLMTGNVIRRLHAQTKLGISTYAILGWNFPVNKEPLGQDVVRFAPLVDVISPMAYPATFAAGYYYRPGVDPRSRMYALVYRTLQGYADLLGPEQAVKLRPWIQGYGITAKNIRDEIDAVYDAGACGFMVWNASNAYDLVFRTMQNVAIPVRCIR